MRLDRQVLGEHIASRLRSGLEALQTQWTASGPINHFVIDDLLPKDWAHAIRAAFPEGHSMTLKRSLRELKYVAAQMNHYHPLLEEAIYAFQVPAVVEMVGRITSLRGLEPDALLYAGGISLMGPGHFLNPHVDNSHDKSRTRYRVINLLYYVSPDWSEESGGNLELWPAGPKEGGPQTLISRFNRLAVMVTHRGSWHSVSRVTAAQERCCLSNYYFSRQPVGDADYFHVTSFRGRPEQRLRDLLLRGDIWLRTLVRRVFPRGLKDNPHYYKRKED